jgi:transcriptional regulator GlxA family with amidase domain
MITDCHFSDIRHSDWLILPALWRSPLTLIKRHPQLIPWLQDTVSADNIIFAIGTSSYLLAEAGLLDHKPATTHWHYLKDFRKRYPRVELKANYLITQANNIYCAGSVNSGADLVIHLLGKLYGDAIARLVEGQFSPEIRRSFENHAYAQHETNIHQDEIIIAAQEWLRAHSAEQISLCTLASQLDLSTRTFNRRFKQATQIAPGDYLQNLRLNNARELLRTSNLSISEVAAQAGYPDSSYFCARFKKVMGLTPLSYRKAARGKLFKIL